jgi:predicted nucleic acid-binding protein
MTLVDTSVWVDHLRRGNPVLKRLLIDAEVLIHPFIVGELALGEIHNRAEIMELLANLPEVTIAGHDEALHLVQTRRLARTGLGWIDAHLIASAMIARAQLLTGDRALLTAARRLGISAMEAP